MPIYPTLTAEQIAVLLNDSAARIAVVSTEAQYRKVASILSQTKLEHILVMDEIANLAAPATTLSSLLQGAPSLAIDMQQWLSSSPVKPEDLATLIYTSGTTGEPKGVMLTHGNIASNLNHSTRTFDWNPDSTCISFLPLSHITARHLDYALFCYGATLAYCGSFDRVPAAISSVKPTVFVAVPRVYEKIREVVERRASSKPIVKKLFTWALTNGRRHREEILRGAAPTSLSPAAGRSSGFQESHPAGIWRPSARFYLWGGFVRCRHPVGLVSPTSAFASLKATASPKPRPSWPFSNEQY